MQITAISDTHGQHSRLELETLACDLFIHCGDITRNGQVREVEYFDRWLGRIDCDHAIVIGGNHDAALAQNPNVSLDNGFYLEDDTVTIDGLVVYGSPYTPNFKDWCFQKPRDELWEHWKQIPDDTDILITHGPPHGFGDTAVEHGDHVGDKALKARVETVQPRLHLFGHVHEGHSQGTIGDTTAANVSVLGPDYRLQHTPSTFNI